MESKVARTIALLERVAEVKHDPDIDCSTWVSKIDGTFIAIEGNEKTVMFLVKNGITEWIQGTGGRTACIGFNSKKGKFYGWSHRAMFGFGTGSKVVLGDCAFRPANLEEAFQASIQFYDYKPVMLEKRSDGIYLRPAGDPAKGEKFSLEWEKVFDISQCGRGEWTAMTLLDDAKVMASDFAEGVS